MKITRQKILRNPFVSRRQLLRRAPKHTRKRRALPGINIVDESLYLPLCPFVITSCHFPVEVSFVNLLNILIYDVLVKMLQTLILMPPENQLGPPHKQKPRCSAIPHFLQHRLIPFEQAVDRYLFLCRHNALPLVIGSQVIPAAYSIQHWLHISYFYRKFFCRRF